MSVALVWNCSEGTQWESPAELRSKQLKIMFLTQTTTCIEILFLSDLGVRFTGGVAAEGNGTTVTSVTGESWQACDNGELWRQQVMENPCNHFCVIAEGEMSLVVCLWVHGFL